MKNPFSVIIDDMKRLIAWIIVKMLTSSPMAFVLVFLGVFILGLVILLVISVVGGAKEINIAPLLIVSFALASLAAVARMYVMKRFARIKV